MIEINSFWNKLTLTKMEKLTIKSFTDHGHVFNLYTYNKNNNFRFECNNFNSKDANEILDYSKYFTYVGNGDCPAGSVGGFSDIFRFELLKKKNWYVDMDVTCLKNFSDLDTEDLVLRPHGSTTVVANIIKCTSSMTEGGAFINAVLDRYYNEINPNSSNWIRPLVLLDEVVKSMNLTSFIVSDNIFGNDQSEEFIRNLKKPVDEISSIPSHAVHWCNTAATTGNWNRELKEDWNNPRPLSLFSTLLRRYKL